MTGDTTSRREHHTLLNALIALLTGVAIAVVTVAVTGGWRQSQPRPSLKEASQLSVDLAKLRNAIDLYHTEHQEKYPETSNGFTVGDLLTQFSTVDGDSCGPADTRIGRIYGPYLDVIPPLQVGPRRGSTGIGLKDKVGIGWIYDPATGSISANCTEVDRAGRRFSDY
jgi:hypothetical protein